MALTLRHPTGLDNPYVQSVLEIAEEILNENKVLTTELLYNIAIRRLNLSRNGLLTVIQFLINKKALVEGSKFTRESVLSNPHRNNLYKFIVNNLGAHFSSIKRKVFPESKSVGQLVWHLEMLLKFNYVKKVKIKNYSVFIPFEMEEEQGIFSFFLKKKTNREIVNLLIKQDSIQKSDIHKQLSEKRENVYYRVKDLINYKIITLTEKKDDEVELNPNKKELIVKILNYISKLNKQ